MSNYILTTEPAATIKGECMTAGFIGGVDLDLFDFGVSMNTTTPGNAGGAQRTSGVIQITPFSIGFRSNSSTISFLTQLQKSAVLNKVIVSQIKTVGAKVTAFSTWTLYQCSVQSVSSLPPDHSFYAATKVDYDAMAPLIQVQLCAAYFDADYNSYNSSNAAAGSLKVVGVGVAPAA